MKKYIRLTCSVCSRTADRVVDINHVTPDRCTITLNCQGRLFPVEYRSNREITSLPQIGVSDWYARNLVQVDTPAVPAPTLIDTASGTTRQLVMAMRLSSPPANGATVGLTLAARQSTPKEFKQFTYTETTNFISVSGADDTLNAKVLRYNIIGTDPDIVEVYVNGVKFQMGTLPGDYQLYSGSAMSTVPPDTVVFNQQIQVGEATQVDIIVSKLNASAEATEKLVFTRYEENESRYSTGSWENVSFVERWNTSSNLYERFYIFTCDVVDATLQLNSIFSPVGDLEYVSGSVTEYKSLGDAFIVFSRQPFTFLDRYTNIVCDTSQLDPVRDYFKYHLIDGVTRMDVTSTSISTVYPLLRIPESGRFTDESLIVTPSIGQTEQIVVDGSVIVGPDA